MSEAKKELDTSCNYQLFINEVEALMKKPDTDAIPIYEKIQIKKERKKRFFPSFSTRVLKEEKKGNMLEIGEYITLYGVYKTISTYLRDMQNASSNLKRVLNNYHYYSSLEFEDNIFSIGSTTRIDCTSLPKLMHTGDYSEYMRMKDDIFKYLPYVMRYKNILESVSQEFSIWENTHLRVEMFDMLNKYNVTLIVSFKDIASLEISIYPDSTDDVSIITYSLNNDVNEYLKNNKLDMLKNILIEKRKINMILEVFKPF